MQTPNKRELQQIAFNHSLDIDLYKILIHSLDINLYKNYTAKSYSFLVNDTSIR